MTVVQQTTRHCSLPFLCNSNWIAFGRSDRLATDLRLLYNDVRALSIARMTTLVHAAVRGYSSELQNVRCTDVNVGI
jgi:hypothetical protein